jgi:hypothetical protein
MIVLSELVTFSLQIIMVRLRCKLRNRRVPNGTQGGVEGRNGI